MIQTLLGHLFNILWRAPTLPRSVQRHPGSRQAGYVMAGMAIVGAYEGYEANQNANSATGAESQSAATQGDLANRDVRTSNQLLSEYDQYGLGATQDYIKNAEADKVDPEQAAAAAKTGIAENYKAQQGAQLRQEADYGVNPNSGAAMSAAANSKLNEAVAQAGAATAARTQAVNTTLARLQGASAAGQNFLAGSEAFTGNGIQGYSSAGGMQGSIANTENEEAAGWGSLAGYGVGQLNQPYYYSGTVNPVYQGTFAPPTPIEGPTG